MLDAATHDDDEPHPLKLLVFAIENYIDAVEHKLAQQGLSADRSRIRDCLLDPRNRHMLIPDA